MIRSWLVALLAMPMAAGVVHPATAQETPTLAGRWSLNRALSQFPKEVGFNADWMSGATAGGDSTPGGRAGAAPGGGRTNFPVSRESREDATRRRLLTDEVREPAAVLTITETATEVTLAVGTGSPRTFHPTGRPEVLQEGDIPLTVTATREGGRLVVVYRVVQGRELRYTYSRIASPSQLVVEVQFLERGKGDTVKRVYDLVPAPAVAAVGRDHGQRSVHLALRRVPPQPHDGQPAVPRRPVLVDVSLMHKGSLAAGAAASHADAVIKGVQDYAGHFATRIRDANK